MCIRPSEIKVLRGPAWETQSIPCGSCWRCNANRVNDFVGRSLCEASVSDWTVALTLTYRHRDDLADVVLTPPHFQQFIKNMRNTGHKIRYLAVGEYGSLRGRAHFHCILFGKGKKPKIPQKTNTHIDQWDHGFVFADWGTDEKALRYVCKYLLKNEEKGNYWFTLSKKPPLGHEWFQRKAVKAAKLGVLPSTFEYLPPGGHKGRPYLMSRATRRDYLQTVAKEMGAAFLKKRKRASEWVGKAIDKMEYDAAVKRAEKWQRENASEAFEAFKQEISERQARSKSADRERLAVDRDIIGMSASEHRQFLAQVEEHLKNAP
ncbi:MAG: hypothetical protein ABJN39_20230 [Sulfitobacter sp.]|uniref:rolling circle replication-associated protein n=1 Tax=Sulfitobacter sp. TaxID=1903071 RepID=UPI003299ACBA